MSPVAILIAIVSAWVVSSGAAAQERPLALSPDSQSIAWGKCPPIFASGCEIAVLHGDAAKPNADVFLRVPGGAKLPSHWHTSAERMTLSTGQLRVKYEGSEAIVLKAGTYAYGPAKLVHEAECISAEPCILFIAFEGPVDAQPAGRK
jgi:quercetin dioxygenase-like cupin family protein